MQNPNDLIEKISGDMPELSRAFRSIAQFVVGQPDQFLNQPIRDLAKTISVSEPTLIRFSRRYGYKGLPDFRIALALSLGKATAPNEPGFHEKAETNFGAKIAIASAASALLANDKSILLDSGSTIRFFAQHLVDAEAKTIMTTGVYAFDELRDSRQHVLMLSGGVLRPDAMSLTGRMVENAISSMTFDTAYIGADSISTRAGLSTFSEEEAHLTRAMIDSASRVVVLADSSKFRSPSLHKICDITDVDILVTDSSISKDDENALKNQKIELVVAPIEKDD